jgi:type IV secretion system protein TrbD
MALRTIPMWKVGNRENLFLGADRELAMTSALLAAILVFVALEWKALVYGLVLWFGALFVLRLMAKEDPKMRHVYLRHRLYKTYYPARSGPLRVNSSKQGRRYK